MQIRFPFQIDRQGAARTTRQRAHVRQMIEQLLFTAPGERVNRPDFGCGLPALLFENASSEIAVATQALVQSALQRWLGDLIQVRQVRARTEQEKLLIDVEYVLLTDRTLQRDSFQRAKM